jgi:chemotaxis protein methyltransferase CheR
MTALHRDNSASLSEDDFNYICQFVYKSAGIVLNSSKREMVYRRLTRIVRERKIASFSEYCQLLRTQSKQEEGYFINAITTNLTSFFREQHHFDYLSQYELPQLLETKKESKRIRIWSSASSTGEEPYSIAITLLEALGSQSVYWDAKILATDIDSNVVAKGKTGIYALKSIEDMPGNLKNKYFKKGRGDSASQVRVENNIRELITFKQLNLLDSWPMQGPFDIIFCRNVIIYFDKKTQSALFERYYDMLAPGGLLLLGHSESLGSYQQYFENIGRTIFRKPY